MKLVFFILMMGFGIGGLIYPLQITRIFGHMQWAEQKLGPGGTYTAWRLLGTVLIVGAILVVRYY